MQGQGMTGELRPVCEGRTHWRSGDKVGMDDRNGEGRNETPRAWCICAGWWWWVTGR